MFCCECSKSLTQIMHILSLRKDKNIELFDPSSCSPNTSSILLKLATRLSESVRNVLRSLLPSNIALSWRKCQKCRKDVCQGGCFPGKHRYPRWTLHAPAAEDIARDRAASALCRDFGIGNMDIRSRLRSASLCCISFEIRDNSERQPI